MTGCLDNKTIVQVAKGSVSEEDKEHLVSCESCRDRLVDVILRLTAHGDCYIWDESSLEPVPSAILQKMKDAVAAALDG